jgi:VanZ family protein
MIDVQMELFRRALPKRLLLAAWGVALLWLALTPQPPKVEHPFFGWDKLHHWAAFCLFTLLAGWAFTGNRRWQLAVIAAVAFGALIEVLQGLFTATRSAEFGDLLADLLGALTAYGIVVIWKKVAR